MSTRFIFRTGSHLLFLQLHLLKNVLLLSRGLSYYDINHIIKMAKFLKYFRFINSKILPVPRQCLKIHHYLDHFVAMRNILRKFLHKLWNVYFLKNTLFTQHTLNQIFNFDFRYQLKLSIIPRVRGWVSYFGGEVLYWTFSPMSTTFAKFGQFLRIITNFRQIFCQRSKNYILPAHTQK